MLRITVSEPQAPVVSLRLDGRIVGPWAAELHRSCEGLLAQGRRLVLDLGGVSFVDGDGIAVLRALRDHPVTLTHCSPFVAAQIRGGSPCSLGTS